MIRQCVYDAVERVQSSFPRIEDLEMLLALRDPSETRYLHATACSIRNAFCQERIALRALIEVSSICCNSCLYCGLNRYNRNASRYAMTDDEILECVKLAVAQGLKTVVIQSGEDGRSTKSIAQVITMIKQSFPIAITLSLGERPYEDYRTWKRAGADRYLLRIESTDEVLYQSIHADRTLSSRLDCLENLRTLGYQVGSGIMIGFPGQTITTIARDIQFFYEKQFDMIGLGPFIPHPQTPLGGSPPGDLLLTLNTIALTRITTKYPWIPATTALGSLNRDYRIDGLTAGANVIMPNFTPSQYKNKYAIYPNKQTETESLDSLEQLAKKANLVIDKGICDTLLPQRNSFNPIVCRE